MNSFEQQLIEIIKSDARIVSILKAVEKLNLNDAWVSAGLIRNKVWDTLHNTTTPINDIDVIYFDNSNISLEREKQLEDELGVLFPNQPWTVKNQSRMHLKNDFDPFSSSYDGVAHFTEIPTAIAVRIRNNDVELMAPYGLANMFEMKVEPTPFFSENSNLYPIYIARMKNKKWKEKWGMLVIEI